MTTTTLRPTTAAIIIDGVGGGSITGGAGALGDDSDSSFVHLTNNSDTAAGGTVQASFPAFTGSVGAITSVTYFLRMKASALLDQPDTVTDCFIGLDVHATDLLAAIGGADGVGTTTITTFSADSSTGNHEGLAFLSSPFDVFFDTPGTTLGLGDIEWWFYDLWIVVEYEGPAVTIVPPLRQYPRPVLRVYPPPHTVQDSNRRGPSAIL